MKIKMLLGDCRVHVFEISATFYANKSNQYRSSITSQNFLQCIHKAKKTFGASGTHVGDGRVCEASGRGGAHSCARPYLLGQLISQRSGVIADSPDDPRGPERDTRSTVGLFLEDKERCKGDGKVRCKKRHENEPRRSDGGRKEEKGERREQRLRRAGASRRKELTKRQRRAKNDERRTENDRGRRPLPRCIASRTRGLDDLSRAFTLQL